MTVALITRSAEVKLMEMLGAISDASDWQAIEFNLSRLLEQYKSEYQVKIAMNLMHDLLKEYQGGIFQMLNHNIVVLCRGLDRPLQNKLIFQLRYLYMDDPLAYSDDGEENPAFCTPYDLSEDWQQFWDISSRRMAMSTRRHDKPSTREEATPARVMEAHEQERQDGSLSVSKLATIESDLRHADLSRVIRRQPICAARPGKSVQRVFDELYIHIAHLRQMLHADVDFFSNRWLFKYLTQLLDERMLTLIKHRPGQYLDQPASINLNVETLLSSWFNELDAMLKHETKVSMVIEVPVVDVFADVHGFMAAKNEVQKRGYRVCLDGLTAQSFLNINRAQLGVDLIKLQWNAAEKSDLQTDENKRLAEAVRMAGSNRVILCRCDNNQAVEFGQAMGISLFQGRHLDAIVDPLAKVAN